jgi:mono/diheme cytochrome c family protein
VLSLTLRSILFATCLTSGLAHAQTPTFPHEQIAAGAKLYADNCSVCHGVKMVETGGGFFDLRTFPPAQRSRFFNSVSNGKNNMPPWRSVLTQEQIGNIFAYVVAGEKN